MPASCGREGGGWTFALGDRVLLGLGRHRGAAFDGDVEEPGFERFNLNVELNLGVRR